MAREWSTANDKNRLPEGQNNYNRLNTPLNLIVWILNSYLSEPYNASICTHRGYGTFGSIYHLEENTERSDQLFSPKDTIALLEDADALILSY